MARDNWKDYEKIINAYKSEDWRELCWLIHSSDATVIEKAGDFLGVDLFKWDDEYHKKKRPEGPEWTPPSEPAEPGPLDRIVDKDPLSKRTRKFLQSGKYPTKYVKSVKDFFSKKIKKAKTAADKSALRERRRQILKEIRQREKSEAQAKKVKQLTTKKKTLQRERQRLIKIPYKSKISHRRRWTYQSSRIKSLEKEVNYLKKLVTIARFATPAKSLAGRYPKAWSYTIKLRKGESKKAGLKRVFGTRPILSLPRVAFGDLLKKVTFTLAREVRKPKKTKLKK